LNPRTTGVLFLVALLLGAFIYVYELPRAEAPDEGDSAGLLFPGLDAEAIDWLTLTTEDGVDVEFERLGGRRWRGIRPLAFAADQSTLDALVRQLAQLEIEGRVEQPAGRGDGPSVDLADFGLGDEFNVLRWRAGGTQHGLRVGRRTPVGSSTYMTRLDQDAETIVYVSTWRVNALRKAWLDLRDRRVVDFDHTLVSDIEARWPGGSVSLAKRGGRWRVIAPLAEQADAETVETLLSDLAFMQADGFVDEPESPSTHKLDGLGFEIELRGGEGVGDGTSFVHRLRITGTREGKRIAEREDGRQFLIAQERLDELPRRLLAYRYKHLADFEVADARRFTLTYTNGEASETIEGHLEAGGWRTSPDTMAAARVGVMLSRLAEFEAQDIVADALGTPERRILGLEPPRLRIAVFGEDAALLARVSLGLRDAERGVFARRAEAEVIYRAAPEVVDWLPLDLKALRSEFLATPGDDDLVPSVGDWAEGEGMPLSEPEPDMP
jgi:hypothetical protein